MMIRGLLFKTIPSLLPRNFRSLEDYIEELSRQSEENWDEKEMDKEMDKETDEEEILWI